MEEVKGDRVTEERERHERETAPCRAEALRADGPHSHVWIRPSM
jgi:hypothetical protein